MVVGGLLHRLVRRAPAQEKLADVAVGDNGFQPPLGRDEQDALAGLVQLAQGFQHGGVGRQVQLFYLDQRVVPLSWCYRLSTVWQTRSQSSRERLVEQGRLTMCRR